MDNYLKLMILAYFKEKQDHYSIYDVMRTLGISISKLDSLLDELIENDLLKYDANILGLTKKGRLQLVNKSIDYYKYSEPDIRYERIDKNSAWSINKPYVPEKFLTKL